jgi:hypothetical protein
VVEGAHTGESAPMPAIQVIQVPGNALAVNPAHKGQRPDVLKTVTQDFYPSAASIE